MVSPRFRFLGQASSLKGFEEVIPGMITTGLAQTRHIVLIARKDAQDLLTQTIERIAKRDYFEAHEGGTISLTQHIHLDVSKEELAELNQILEVDVSSRMRELGVDLLVYGKVLETEHKGIRLDMYLLDIASSSLCGAEGIETLPDRLSTDVSVASSRLAWAVMNYLEQRHGRQRPRVFAVLPFRNISNDSKLDRWQEGLTEEFITVLKNAKALQLVERAATARYKNQDNLDLIKVGRELNVDVVLWGSYDVYEDEDQTRKIIVRARLVETESGNILETFKEEGKIGYAVQSKIAQNVMQALYVQPTSLREVEAPPTESVDALEYVRIGIHHFDNQDYARAIESFRQAIKIDPTYPDAHYHLGMTYKTLKSYDKALEQFKTALGNAYDQSYGQLLWRFRTNWKIWAKPITDSGTVYIGVENKVYALDKQRGSPKWVTQVAGEVDSAAFVGKDHVCVAASHRVYSLDLKTGQIRWEFEPDGEVKADLVGDERMLFVSASWDDDLHPPSGRIYALELASGALAWQFDQAQPVGAPCVFKKQVFFGTKDGRGYSLDASSGKLNWKIEMQKPVEYPPAATGDILYWVSENRFHAVHAASGEILWDLLFQDVHACAPVIDREVVYAAFGQKLYYIAVQPSQGVVRWSYQTSSPIGSINIWDGIVYATTRVFSFAEPGDHLLLAIDQDTGQLYWRTRFGDSLFGATHIDDGTLYLGCRNHNLYALNVKRPSAGLIRSTELWNQIGLVQLDLNQANDASEAFQRCVALDPTGREANLKLYEIYKRQKRMAKALEVYQEYLGVLSEDERIPLQVELKEGSGLQWTFDTGRLLPFMLFPLTDQVTADEPDMSPIVPSPASAQGVLYIGSTDGKFHALDLAKGQELWNVSPGDPIGPPSSADSVPPSKSIRSTAAVRDGRVFIGTADGLVKALRAENGSTLWSFRTGGRVDSSPVVSDGVLYVGSDDGGVCALTGDEGRLLWRAQTGGRVKSSPSPADCAVYVGSYDGKIYSLDIKTGKVLWTFQTGDIINSSPVVCKDLVYLGPDDNYIYALDVHGGKLKWKYQVEEKSRSILRFGIREGSGVSTFGFIPSTPCVDGSSLYVGTNGASRCMLYSLDLESGKLKWKYAVENGGVGSAAVYDGIVYVGAGGILFHDQHIYGVNAADGSLVWKYRTGGDILSAPVIEGGCLYCWAMDGQVYAFDISRVSGYLPERDTPFYASAGAAHLENGEIEAAVKDFEMASGLDPDDADSCAGLADCYRQLGKIDLEQQTLERLQTLNPSATHSYWRLGDLYTRMNRVDRAIDQFQRYINVSEETAKPIGHIMLGGAYEGNQSFEEAMREYDLAISIGGRFIAPFYGTEKDKDIALSSMFNAYRNKSVLLFRQGKDLESGLNLQQFSEAAEQMESLPPDYFLTLGLVKLQREDYDEADLLFESGLKEKMKIAELWSYLGSVLNEQTHQFDRAYQCFKRAWDLVRPDSSAAINLAETALGVGRYNEAYQLASQVAAEKGDPKMILNGKLFACLASFLVREGARAEAELKVLIEYRQSLPPDFENHFSYNGTVHYLTNKTDMPENLKSRLLKILDYVQNKTLSTELIQP